MHIQLKHIILLNYVNANIIIYFAQAEAAAAATVVASPRECQKSFPLSFRHRQIPSARTTRNATDKSMHRRTSSVARVAWVKVFVGNGQLLSVSMSTTQPSTYKHEMLARIRYVFNGETTSK